MANQRTYNLSTPCPCDDCDHHNFCKKQGMSCKVSRYWEKNGNILYRYARGNAPRMPVDRMPDSRL